MESGSSLSKSDANGLSFRGSTQYEAPQHLAQEFRAALERRRRISDDRSGVDVSAGIF